jgi:hypothetical protein
MCFRLFQMKARRMWISQNFHGSDYSFSNMMEIKETRRNGWRVIELWYWTAERFICCPEKLFVPDLREYKKLRFRNWDKKVLRFINPETLSFTELNNSNIANCGSRSPYETNYGSNAKRFVLPVEPSTSNRFDNSNIQGTNLAACVVFKDGKPSKKRLPVLI